MHKHTLNMNNVLKLIWAKENAKHDYKSMRSNAVRRLEMIGQDSMVNQSEHLHQKACFNKHVHVLKTCVSRMHSYSTVSLIVSNTSHSIVCTPHVQAVFPSNALSNDVCKC